MNINTMLKGGLIALFFSTQIVLANQPTVPPENSSGVRCSIGSGSYLHGKDFESCAKSGQSIVEETLIPKVWSDSYHRSIAFSHVDGTRSYFTAQKCASNMGTANSSCVDLKYGNSYPWEDVVVAGPDYFDTVETQTCPPKEHVNYIYPIFSEDEPEKIVACDDDNPNFQKCPVGHFKYAVKGECVPVDCPSTGTADTIWGSGSTYSNNTGTYCNGQCAFSVKGGQNDSGSKGNIPLKVVSNGAVCGDGTGSWHSDGNGEDNCTQSSLSTGATFVECSNGNSDNGEETEIPIDLGEQKDEEPLELIPVLENCGADDVACEVRNLQEKVDSENKELKAEQQEQHNKKIEADEKSTTKLINAIQELKDFNSIGNEQIVAALKADTGTGSSGGGSGTVTLDGDGAGLTDSEIGDAVGGLDDEISEDTVTLSNYSAPYSGWISTSGCPSTQSTTLTINGITSTFDADHTPMCSFFTFLGKILLAASYVGVAFMIQRSI